MIARPRLGKFNVVCLETHNLLYFDSRNINRIATNSIYLEHKV